MSDEPDHDNPTLSIAWAVGNALPYLAELVKEAKRIGDALEAIEKRLVQMDL